MARVVARLAGRRVAVRLHVRQVLWRTLVTGAALVFSVLVYTWLTLPDVRRLVRENPTDTAWMRLRAAEAARDGKTLRKVQRWVPYGRISQHVKRAVLVAEDDAFFEHEGLDLVQLKAAIEDDLARGKAMRGASTITQQLAKNLYLSPDRDPLRKLKELIIARRLEAELSKARIFEIYLNVIEWGDGIWGIEAASRTYFGLPASALSPSQAALLAGAIVNPRVLTPARPTPRLLRRQKIILGRMGGVKPPIETAPVRAAAETHESAPDSSVTDEPDIPVATPVDPAPAAGVPDAAPPDTPIPAAP